MRDKAAKAKAKANRTRTRAGVKGGGVGAEGQRRSQVERTASDVKGQLGAMGEASVAVESRPVQGAGVMLQEKRDRGPAPPMPVPIATFNV